MLWKINPFTIFSASWEMRVHISCGRLKAGAGKDMGELKPTATSTKNSWTCSPLRNKAGAAGCKKGLMVPCASPIKPHQPVLQKGYGGPGLGSALHCHHIARAGRNTGTGQWETEAFQCDSGSARVLLSWHGGVAFLLEQFSAHLSYCLTLKATASSVRNKLHWSIHTSALPGFLSVPLAHSRNHEIFTAKVTTTLSAHSLGTLASTHPPTGSFQDLLWQEPLKGTSPEHRLALTLPHIISLCISRVVPAISRPEF